MNDKDNKVNDSFDEEIKNILERDPQAELERGDQKLFDPYFDEPLPPPEPGALADINEFDGQREFYSHYNLTPKEKLTHICKVGALKNAAMILTGDTTHDNELQRYLSITKELRFETVLELSFSKNGANDKFFIQWRKDGILLAFDTHSETHVNSGHFYYNWARNKNGKDVSSSGHWLEDGIIAGSHDAREALKFNIRQLEKNGKFLPKWKGLPHLWLIHHGDKVDWRDDSSKIINAERIALLPPEVREAIGGLS